MAANKTSKTKLTPETKGGQSVGRPAADELLDLARARGFYFKTASGACYAEIKTDGKSEILPIEGVEFRAWLEMAYYAKHKRPPSSTMLQNAISSLTAYATHEGGVFPVFQRIARRKGKYYIDLCDSARRIVRVDKSGWKVLRNAPVKFIRPRSMRALPYPNKGGDFSELSSIANVPKNSLALIMTWMIECFRPETPFVGLALLGQQGSAKSTLQRMLRELIDPAEQDLLTMPRSMPDLHAAAKANHLLSFENVSTISDAMSDELCAILTGAGTAARTLYTNSDQYVIALKRPVVMNGIEQFVTRPDLIDRFVVLNLPVITDEQRRTDQEIRTAYEVAKPKLFGALLTAFHFALAELPAVREEALPLPRMADFAMLGEAVRRSRGGKPGAFLRSYNRNRRLSSDEVIDASVVGSTIRLYMAEHEGGIAGVVGSVSRDLNAFAQRLAGSNLRIAGWPQNPKAFANELRRLTPPLRLNGIIVEIGDRTREGYACRIHREQKPSDRS